ncbi:HPr kinase/phosphorylase [Enterovirga aerilata]|uniref:HPr kinase/phosphorylase C-terminal domain-containing protein n=1 Tax=Enterovirga aerilata TaxID=2730920 RepID=A0A849IB86_9HYPH|nr:hypothetical protein [Enterovirga sp. DB1703]NNM71203.1 hypothetical protein [Enterovirga sp. DB1703]
MSASAATIHATALVLGEDGILLRGSAGAGKSSLARDLVQRARETGRHAALVADDRVALAAAHGRVLARPPSAIAGLLEIRGVGIVRVPFVEAAVLRLVVDLEHVPARLLDEDAGSVSLQGIPLPRIAADRASALGSVMWRLGHLHDPFVTVP